MCRATRVGEVRWCPLVAEEEEGGFTRSCLRAAQRGGWGDLASQLADPVLAPSGPHPKKQLSPGQTRVGPGTDDITDLSESRGSREPRQYCTCVSGSCLRFIHLESFLGNSLVFSLHLHSIVLPHQQPAGSPALKWTMPPRRTVHLKTYV